MTWRPRHGPHQSGSDRSGCTAGGVATREAPRVRGPRLPRGHGAGSRRIHRLVRGPAAVSRIPPPVHARIAVHSHRGRPGGAGAASGRAAHAPAPRDLSGVPARLRHARAAGRLHVVRHAAPVAVLRTPGGLEHHLGGRSPVHVATARPGESGRGPAASCIRRRGTDLGSRLPGARRGPAPARRGGRRATGGGAGTSAASSPREGRLRQPAGLEGGIRARGTLPRRRDQSRHGRDGLPRAPASLGSTCAATSRGSTRAAGRLATWSGSAASRTATWRSTRAGRTVSSTCATRWCPTPSTRYGESISIRRRSPIDMFALSRTGRRASISAARTGDC